ncbi:hypothetical protein TNCV_274021 [Trichonephila clavipes]|nr:hypothetical protein TNCV_274021 [Trichonephila clavipes]
MVNLPWQEPRFPNSVGILINTMDALHDFRLNETLKMLRWCLNVFGKIIDKHLHKSLRGHISRRRRLRESIRRKWSQFWQSGDWYLLRDNSLVHISQLASGVMENI